MMRMLECPTAAMQARHETAVLLHLALANAGVRVSGVDFSDPIVGKAHGQSLHTDFQALCGTGLTRIITGRRPPEPP